MTASTIRTYRPTGTDVSAWRTMVDVFVDRELDPQSFGTITTRDDVFALLVEIAADSFSGRRLLKSVRDTLAHEGNQRERLRLVKQAVW
jgi:hypothetical protein